MVNTISRTQLIGGLWLAGAAVIVATSVVMDARLSTSALLLAVCAIPLGVVFVIGLGAPPPTVAEVLYAVDHPKDGRR
jgi:hypothetical protein